jgi:hypothetical protein
MTRKNCGVASKAVERGRARNMIELQKSRRESDTHEITCSPKSRALALATETATERTIYSTRSATALRSRIAKAARGPPYACLTNAASTFNHERSRHCHGAR